MKRNLKMLSLATMALLVLSMSCNKGADATKGAASVSQAPPAGGVQVDSAGGAPADAAMCAECGKPEAECTCEGHDHAAKAECADPNCTGCEGKDAAACAACPNCKGKDAAACANCPDCKGKGAQPASASTTPDGIRIVDATAVDVDPTPYVGRVAISGKVGDVWEEKGTFTLVDMKKMPGCTDGCCPSTNIPVSVPSSEFTGTFPKAGDTVLVICNLSTTPTGGYQVQAQEVRLGDKTILTQGKSAQS